MSCASESSESDVITATCEGARLSVDLFKRAQKPSIAIRFDNVQVALPRRYRISCNSCPTPCALGPPGTERRPTLNG